MTDRETQIRQRDAAWRDGNGPSWPGQSDGWGTVLEDRHELLRLLDEARDAVQTQNGVVLAGTRRIVELEAEIARLRAPSEADTMELAKAMRLRWENSPATPEADRALDEENARALTANGDQRVREARLFATGSFVSHSGLTLPFKIDCDALGDDDLDCLARIYAGPEGHPGGRYFCRVEGIPRGGIRFASALRRHLDLRPNHAFVLVVDDVLTTGGSLNDWKREHSAEEYVHAIVIFARSPCPRWVDAIFTLNPSLGSLPALARTLGDGLVGSEAHPRNTK